MIEAALAEILLAVEHLLHAETPLELRVVIQMEVELIQVVILWAVELFQVEIWSAVDLLQAETALALASVAAEDAIQAEILLAGTVLGEILWEETLREGDP